MQVDSVSECVDALLHGLIFENGYKSVEQVL